MEHIDQGLSILNYLNAPSVVLDAWCLHPLFQGDGDLNLTLSDPESLEGLSNHSIILAMEYRHVANAYLPKHEIKKADAIWLGPRDEMRTLLIADKVQNYWSFLTYLRHRELLDPQHELKLCLYFQSWMQRLEITSAKFILYSSLFTPVEL